MIPPDLLKYLSEMGHGDEIVLSDGNFPGNSTAKRLVRCDGQNILPLLNCILHLIPLDQSVEPPVMVMKVDGPELCCPVIWDDYLAVVKKHAPQTAEQGFKQIERQQFYKRSTEAYVVVQTSESALYSNVILKKGIIYE